MGIGKTTYNTYSLNADRPKECAQFIWKMKNEKSVAVHNHQEDEVIEKPMSIKNVWIVVEYKV